MPTDSLKIFMHEANNPNLSFNRRAQYTERAYKLLSAEGNSQDVRNSLADLSNDFLNLKDYRNFNRSIRQVLKLSISAKDSINIANAHNLLGNQYLTIAKNDSAYSHFLKAERILLKSKDSLLLGKNFVDKAFIQLYESDYTGCEISSIQALTYLKNSSNVQSKYNIYNLIGICSNELKNFDNAIIYHEKALNIASTNNLAPKFHLQANTRNNIGVVYQNLRNYQKSIDNFEAALSEKNLLNDNPALYSMITDNLAYSKFKLRNLANVERLFLESLHIRELNNLNSGVIINKIHLSEYYAELSDTVKAQKLARQALHLAKSTKVSGDVLGSLKQLSLVEHKFASQYSNEYIAISDSLQLAERVSKDKFARIAFETDEIILEKDHLADQNRTLLYFFMGTLFIGVLLFVIRTQRARNRELLLKQAQQKANEDIYNLMISQQNKIEESRMREKKRIAQELHDGVLGRLFGARLNLDSLNRVANEEAVAKRNNYLNELKNIEQDIREISHDLNREKYVLINNFIAILNNLLEEQKASFGSEVLISIDETIKWESIGNTLKINLYRIIQESLQNINKYANAGTIKLNIKKSDENLVLNLSDDGDGFNINSKKKGIGLQNMISRTQELDGTFDIKSNRGKGVVITVSFPIGSKQHITA